MLFNSLEFATFFVVVYSLYWLLRGKFRLQNVLLLAGSYVFYGWWDERFLELIVISTAVDYASAILIDRGYLSRRQRAGLSCLVLASCFLFVVLPYGTAAGPDSAAAGPGAGLLPRAPLPWAILSGLAAAVALANVLYPVLTRLPEARRRKLFLTLSVVSNLSLLAFFKYFNFFADNFVVLAESLIGWTPGRWTLEIVLPVGISFYTFQTMSYTIDVYRRQLDATDDFLAFATYVAFFPQLVAGPIERGKHLLPQFLRQRPAPTSEELRSGVWLIVWGLFKKLVVADNMATVVNIVFGPYDALTQPVVVPEDGLRMLVGVYAFAFQIYGDFSGYTDIARGTARLLGFDLMLNFNLPYFATSPSSFWRRWHISLSTWLRDYLYIPLGGNREPGFKTYRNLTLTMLLGGLWHGAAWTFVIWGAYHGLLLVTYRALGLRTERRAYPWWVSGLQGLLMFHLTCLGWLLFRAQNVTTIAVFLESIFLSPLPSTDCWLLFQQVLYYGWFLVLFQVVQGVSGKLDPMAGRHWFLRLNVWLYVVLSLLVLSSRGGQEFIYFAF